MSNVPYDGPPVQVSMLQLQTYPPQNMVTVTLAAPSSGWKLNLDRGEVVDHTARLWLTLERPAAGEATTRAISELQATYKTTREIDAAEILINTTQRGVQQTSPEYRLAKSVRADETAGAMQQTPPPQPSSPAPSNGPLIDTSPYDGPPVQVEVVQAKRLPPISTATIKVTVPTGGWKLTLDRAKVENDTAKIFLTLEKPADDEIVPQALTTLTESYTSDSPPFHHAEIYIFQSQRGIMAFAANYRLAASN